MNEYCVQSIKYICQAIVLIVFIIGGAYVLSPTEFTFKIEMDNNTKEAFESINYTAIGNERFSYSSEKYCQWLSNEGYLEEPCVFLDEKNWSQSCYNYVNGITFYDCNITEEELRRLRN